VAPIATTNNAQTDTMNFCIDPSPLLAGFRTGPAPSSNRSQLRASHLSWPHLLARDPGVMTPAVQGTEW